MKRISFVNMLVLGLVLTVGQTAQAQDTVWTRTYGHADELGLCGNVCLDGGYIAGGISYYFSGLSGEFWLVRTDSNGDTLWTRNYGGDRWQEAHYVIETTDGGFAICGATNIAVGDYDMFIVKTNASGDTLLTRRFGSAGIPNDDGQAIIQTSDGGYLAVGNDHVGINTQLLMVKLNASGDSLWTKRYGGPYSDYGYGVVETADQGLAITGAYSLPSGSTDLWLLRTYPNGDTLWTRRFDFHGGMDCGNGIVLAPDGGFVIGGRTWLGSYSQLLVLRTDSLGHFVWSREFGATSTDEFAESIDMTADSCFVIGGGAGPIPYDFYIAKVSATGDSLWARRYDGPGGGQSDVCYEVRVDPAGFIMAFGHTDTSSTGYDSEYWVLKIRGSQTAIDDDTGILPGQSFTMENYPNPFNLSTMIRYRLPARALVSISIYNLLGQRVATLDPGLQESGMHSVSWDADAFPSGIYFAWLQTLEQTKSTKMLLLR